MSKPTTITLDKLQETNAGLVLSGQIAIIDDLHINQMPQQAQLGDCSLLWLCEAGSARYVCDTKDYVTGPNDFSIISREQIIGSIHANKDFKGVGMVISQDFFSEVIQNVHELASIFMFARTHPVSHLLDTEADTFKDYHQRIKQKILDTDHPASLNIFQRGASCRMVQQGDAYLSEISLRDGERGERAHTQRMD